MENEQKEKLLRNPIQPLHMVDGIIRFKQNLAVRRLLDFAKEHGCGLNELACMEDISNDDRIQLAQLIGYSLSGFADLSYVDDNTYTAAANMFEVGADEKDARIQELEEKIERMKAGLRDAVSNIFNIAPEDLK